jgi:outer membrane lipoprotein-sorting protein
MALSRASRPGPSALRQLLRVAAVVLLAAGVVVGLGELMRVQPPLAFAQVAQKLRDTHSLAYRLTMEDPGTKKPVKMEVLLKEPGRIRMETAGGPVSIGRLGEEKVLALDPDTKMAWLVELKRPGGKAPPAQPDPAHLLEELRNLIEKESQPAGKKQIGDVEAQGFRVKVEGQDWLVWADPTTRLPLRVEIKIPVDAQVVLSEFRINPELEDALFRMEPPEGYKQQTVQTELLNPEDALALYLRVCAEASGGKFPERLDDWVGNGKRVRAARDAKKVKPTAEEVIRLGMSVGRVGIFLGTLKEGDYAYRPGGAKLGDADKVIFWYRSEGAAKYRALYGDLHWADATAEQLPARPKP